MIAFISEGESILVPVPVLWLALEEDGDDNAVDCNSFTEDDTMGGLSYQNMGVLTILGSKLLFLVF